MTEQQQRTNRQWILKSRPKYNIDPSLFELKTVEVPALTEGHVLAETLYLSFDPAQRGYMAIDAYIPKVPLGEPMRAAGVAQVIESKHPKFQPGDLVNGLCNWQEYVIFNPDEKAWWPFDKLPPGMDPVRFMSLAPTGLTAYFGLLEVGKPKAGETVLVSGAAGATGSWAGQIAKIKGCTVVGIAGGPQKCAWLKEKANFDHAIDYKNEHVGERLKELCPNGVDVFFDNVGGEILDQVLLNLAQGARIVLCGAISQYNLSSPEELYGLKHIIHLTGKDAKAEGFIITKFLGRAMEGILTLNSWINQGRLVVQTDIQEGFDNVPATLERLFTGANLGKQILKVTDPPLPLPQPSAVESAVMKILSFVYSWRS